MSETASRPSRTPDAVSAKPASRQVTRAAKRRASSLTTGCAAVVTRCTAPVSAEAKSYFRASISDDAAARDGRRYTARDLLTEWLRVSSSLAQSTLGGRVTGFGPARFRYTAELAHETAVLTERDDADDSDSTSSTTEATPSKSLAVDLDALKLAVAQALRNLGIEARGSTSRYAGAAAVSASLEDLASAVRRAQTNVPAEVLADAGLTSKVIDALSDAAHGTLSAHTSSLEARVSERSVEQRENVMLGRLAREMRLLLASAKASRKGDSAIPQVRSRLLSPTKRKAQATPPQPTPTPADPVAPR